MNLAFLFNSQDVQSFLDKKIPSGKLIIFASGLDTITSLNQHKISFRQFNSYIPLSQTKKNYIKAHKTALLFNKSIYASVRIFFLELGRSVFLANKFIAKHYPSTVFISDDLNESLYQKYFRETFNLLPQAIIALCKNRHIKIVIIGQQRQPGSLIKSFINLHLSTIISLLTNKTTVLPKNSNKKTILFSASDYHLTNLKNVIELLASRYQVISLGKSTARERHHPYSYLRLTDILYFWLESLVKPFFILIRPQPQPWKKHFPNVDLYHWPILKQLCFYWRLVLIPQGHLLNRSFSRLIKTLNPILLVTSNSIDNYNRILHLATQQHNIPDVVILHYPMTNDINSIEEQSGIEKYLLVSSSKAQNIISQQPGSYHVLTTGSPTFDQYSSPSLKLPTKFIPPLRILFLLTQEFLYFQDKNDLIVAEALNELGKLPFTINVTIRQHPHELLISISKVNFQMIIRNNTRLIDELTHHDIIITQATSAAVYAIILKKPLIYLNTHGLKNFHPFAKEGAALGVYRIKQLLPSIQSLIQKPKQLGKPQDKFVEKYCGKIDGKSSTRILAALEKIITRENWNTKDAKYNQELKG